MKFTKQKRDAYYNKFDIVEAYYLFFSNYHEGQGSDKYRRLSKMSYFKPRFSLTYKALSENSKNIYDNLVDNYRDSIYYHDYKY
jgi:hypothetical protein